MTRPRAFILTGAIAALASVSASAERIAIVSENNAANLWSQAPGTVRVTAGYPPTAADKAQDVCVNIGYLIGKDGSTSNFTQMKAWSSSSPGAEPKPETIQPFVQSAAAAVSMWRLAPRSGKHKSIYTSATFAFEGSKTATQEQIRANCRIDDLQDFVAQAHSAKNRRGDLSRAQRDAQQQNRDMTTRQY